MRALPEPTFDTLKSLVSMCESSNCEEEGENSTTGMPLRVATVADGGAVIIFGVTHGEVPRVLRTNLTMEVVLITLRLIEPDHWHDLCIRMINEK